MVGEKVREKKGAASLYLVRHAMAGERRRWNGDDRNRPLSRRGWRQAKRLVSLFDGRTIDRLITSPYVRCRQTLEPLAAERGIRIEEDTVLEEGVGIEGALALVGQLTGANVVLCSHGDLIPALVTRLRDGGLDLREPVRSEKGSTWVIETVKSHFVEASYLPPPA